MAFTWLAFVIQALASSFLIQYADVSSLSILILVFTSAFLVFDLSKYDFPKQVFILLLIAYLFRLFLMFFDIYGREFLLLPHSGFDSEMFHEATIRGLNSGDYGRGAIYSFVVGVVYSMFGIDKIIGQYFNVLISLQAILVIYKTLGLYRISENTKYIVLAVMAFIPNFAIMSSLLLRESILIFLCVSSFYYFSKWVLNDEMKFLIPAFALGLLMVVFHSGSVFLVGAYAIFIFLYNSHTQSFDFNIRSILVVLVFMAGFNFIYENYSDLFFGKFMNVERINDVTEIYVMGESGYTVGLAIGNPILNLIINTPLRIFYFIFSPLPWNWRGQTDILAFLFSSLFYGGTLFYGVRHMITERSQHKKHVLMLLIIIGFGLILFSWGVSNAGTALRHRDKFIGLFILLLALLIESKRSKQREGV